MNWVSHESSKVTNFFSYPPPQPPPSFARVLNFFSFPPPSPSNSGSSGSNTELSPSLMLSILILAIIIFLSGLLHILVRFIFEPRFYDQEQMNDVTDIQAQLQQLFNLHDAGLDQSFIDTLPVFIYKDIINSSNNPFDCAVCLSEFEQDDNLRLLPKCSHAFHTECIDTWLLSHSTCPLCRTSLLPDFTSRPSPVVHILQSESEASREIDEERDNNSVNSGLEDYSHLGFHEETELDPSSINTSDKLEENGGKDDVLGGTITPPSMGIDSEGSLEVVLVKLGKYRSVGGVEGEVENEDEDDVNTNNVVARRCYSMGSFEYVMDENSFLQVPIITSLTRHQSLRHPLPFASNQKLGIFDCEFESSVDFSRFKRMKNDGNGIGRSKRHILDQTNGNTRSLCDHDNSMIRKESLSLSKIWTRGKEKVKSSNVLGGSLRKAFSFRFPSSRKVVVDEFNMVKAKSVSGVSEFGSERWENEGGGSELKLDEENQSCNSLDSQGKTPSFARKTLLWLSGKQNKVVHSSSFTPNDV